MSEKKFVSKLEKYDCEIQCWLYGGVKTPSRFKKFYESMISIHLGGVGLMEQHYNEVLKGASFKELKTKYQNYKINHPEMEIVFDFTET